MISDTTIAAIKDRMDIEEVVADYVELKRRGGNLWALCPFHSERTPSFSVSPRHGIYKCFGCGKSGDAIGFVREMDGIGYVEALAHLAQKYGIQVERTAVAYTPEAERAREEGTRLSHLMAFAQTRYAEQLHDHAQAEEARCYCKKRGLSETLIKTFGLGYALKEWTSFMDTAHRLKYPVADLVKVGLVVQEANKNPYDRFRDRLLFPIRSIAGRVVAFGGRSLSDRDQVPKYINSPETDFYTKGAHLYGLYEGRGGIRRKKQLYLVEGYMDVLAMHAAGFTNTVGVMGTSLTDAQVDLLARHATQITLMLDGDEAGKLATFRSIDLLLAKGLNVYVMPLKPDEDPDSCIQRAGPKDFGVRLEKETQSFLDYEARVLLSQADKDAMRQGEALKRILSSLACVPDEAERHLLLEQCKPYFNLSEDVFLRALTAALKRQSAYQPKELAQEKVVDTSRIFHRAEHDVLYHLVHRGAEKIQTPDGKNVPCATFILEDMEDLLFCEPTYAQALEALRQQVKLGVFDVQHLIKYSDTHVQKVLTDIVFLPELRQTSPHWEGMALDNEANGHWLEQVYRALLRFKYRAVRRRLRDLHKRIDSTPEAKTAYMDLKQTEIKLSRALGLSVHSREEKTMDL